MKKITAILLTLLCVFSFTLPALAYGNGQLSRGSKGLTAADARLVLRLAVGLEPETPENLALGDVDLDGKVTAADARHVLRAAVDLERVDGNFYDNEYDVLRSGFFDVSMKMTADGEESVMKLAKTGDAIYLRGEITIDRSEENPEGYTIVLPMLRDQNGLYVFCEEEKIYDVWNDETIEALIALFNSIPDAHIDPAEAREMLDLDKMFSEFKDFSDLPALSEADARGTGTFYGEKAETYTFITAYGTSVVYMQGKRLLGMADIDKTGLKEETVFEYVHLTVPTASVTLPADYTATQGDAFFYAMASAFGG